MDILKSKFQPGESQSLSTTNNKAHTNQLSKTQPTHSINSRSLNTTGQTTAYQVLKVEALTHNQLKGVENIPRIVINERHVMYKTEKQYLVTLNHSPENKERNFDNSKQSLRLISNYMLNPGELIFLSKETSETNKLSYTINKKQLIEHIIATQLRNTLPHTTASKGLNTYLLLQQFAQTPQLKSMLSKTTLKLINNLISLPSAIDSHYLSELIKKDKYSTLSNSTKHPSLKFILSAILIDLNRPPGDKNTINSLANTLLANYQNPLPLEKLSHLFQLNQPKKENQKQELIRSLTNLTLQSMFSIHTKQWQTINNNLLNENESFHVDIPLTCQDRLIYVNAQITKPKPDSNKKRTIDEDQNNPNKWQVNLLLTLSNDILFYVSLKYLKVEKEKIICNTAMFCNDKKTLQLAKTFEPSIISHHKNINITTNISYFNDLPKTVNKNTVNINMVDLHI